MQRIQFLGVGTCLSCCDESFSRNKTNWIIGSKLPAIKFVQQCFCQHKCKEKGWVKVHFWFCYLDFCPSESSCIASNEVIIKAVENKYEVLSNLVVGIGWNLCCLTFLGSYTLALRINSKNIFYLRGDSCHMSWCPG